MIIDAKDRILGRLSSIVAHKALLGHKVDVINCEECCISGNKLTTLAVYVRRLDRKAPNKGPYFQYRRPDMFVKRTIRGMLPFKRSRGRVAYKNVICHVGVPESLKGQKPFEAKIESIERLSLADYVKIKNICKEVGGKL